MHIDLRTYEAQVRPALVEARQIFEEEGTWDTFLADVLSVIKITKDAFFPAEKIDIFKKDSRARGREGGDPVPFAVLNGEIICFATGDQGNSGLPHVISAKEDTFETDLVRDILKVLMLARYVHVRNMRATNTEYFLVWVIPWANSMANQVGASFNLSYAQQQARQQEIRRKKERELRRKEEEETRRREQQDALRNKRAEEEEKRQYYLDNFAFDPDHKVYFGAAQHEYLYEAFFPLRNDLPLDQAGITIGARVTRKEDGTIINHIVFRRGTAERLVNCVHTAICTMTRVDILRLQDGLEDAILEHVKTAEDARVRLPAEEHFVALKSYVAGIAEMGIANAMNASYYSDRINPEVLPFGFNAAMQKQICTALRELAPAATRGMIINHIAELCDTVPADWLESRLKLLDDIYDLKDAILTDIHIFEAIYLRLPLGPLKELARKYRRTDPRIREILKIEDPAPVSTGIPVDLLAGYYLPRNSAPRAAFRPPEVIDPAPPTTNASDRVKRAVQRLLKLLRKTEA